MSSTPPFKTAVKSHSQVAGDGHCHNWIRYEAYFGTVFTLLVLPQFDQDLELMVVLGQAGEQYFLGLYLYLRVGGVVFAVLTPVSPYEYGILPQVSHHSVSLLH